MVVPGKNASESQKDSKKKGGKNKTLIYVGGGFGGILLIAGIVFLFRILVLSPGSDDDISDQEIERILKNVNKTSSDTPVYGGLTESEKKLRKKFEQSESESESAIDKDLVLNDKDFALKPEKDVKTVKTENAKVAEKTKEIKKDQPKKVVKEEKKVVQKKPEAPKPKKAPAEKTKALPKPDKNFKGFTIQIGSFKDIKSAEKKLDDLLKRGFEAELMEVDLGAKGVWNRLRVGKYASKKDAEKEVWKLGTIGYKNTMVTTY